MRKFLVPAAAAVLLATSSMSFAATSSTTGTVKAYDAKAMTLTLQDGTVFHLPKHFKDPGIKVGEKVSVSWTMVKKLHDASTVKIVN